MRHRHYDIDEHRSHLTSDRLAFRVYAGNAHATCVVLFGDVPAAARAKAKAVPPVMPSEATLEAALATAEAEAPPSAPTLVVIALHASTKARLSAEAEAFVDAVSCDTTGARRRYLEVWHTRYELGIDVLGHSLTPRQWIASPTELAHVRTKAWHEQLPLMLHSDPAARWLGARVDDIVVEERDDEDTGRSLYYRRVV